MFQKKIHSKPRERGTERQTETETERMSSRESDNTVSVIHCRPSVIFLNNETGPGPLPAPREASEPGPTDLKRKVSKLTVRLSQSGNLMFGNYFLAADELCLETLTSSFVMEPAFIPGEDQCAKQLNLRNRKRLSPVYTDENLPSKRTRRRKYSDCSSSSTSTVTQDSERLVGSPQE